MITWQVSTAASIHVDDGSSGTVSSDNDFENQTMELPPLPLFQVEVPEAVKKGENVLFTIHTTVPAEDRGLVVLRQFEDIEWLHHNLITSNNTDGVIIPPLPIKPQSDPRSAEAMSRRQLGDNTKVLRGDQFEQDCKSVQKYLQLLLAHQTFGRDKTLASFLTDDEAPVRVRLNKGLMNRLTSVLDIARKANHKDVDEYFTTQRHVANEFSKAIKEASVSFNKLMVAQWRLSSSYRLLATELTSCTAERDDGLVKVNRILKLLSDGCDDIAGCYDLKSIQGETTLGFYLDLMARYSESLKEMHFRRTSALIDYESTEKTLEKAKPVKKAVAQEAFDAAKKVFETSSEKAKKEINSFTQVRLLNSSEALTKYAELQIKISQDCYSQLFHSRKTLLELQL